MEFIKTPQVQATLASIGVSNPYLVGGFEPLWKNISPIGMIIPNIWEKKMFQTSNQL